MNTEPTPRAASDLLSATMRMWETAFRTGTRIQEESARRFTGLLPPWPTQPELLFTEAIQTAQKSMEEAMRVVNESTRRNLDVVEKGLEAGRAENAGEGQAKAREVWEASLGAIRANTQTIVEVNTRVLQSWAELGKRLGESMANGRA